LSSLSNLRPTRILVTGGAGFIGSHLCERLLRLGNDVSIVDNFDPFYDPAVKRKNLEAVFSAADSWGRDVILCEGDIRDEHFIGTVVSDERPDAVVHLAALAGVRPSIERPLLYEEVNVRGTMNLLEGMRRAGVRRLVFGSSSSVYGNNEKVPFSEEDRVDNPISPYAATKKAGELLCHTYHHLYAMRIACLRFFTVYGPRQRPDLAIHKFARLIRSGKAIPVFGDGTTSRDYTYVDDILDGIVGALEWSAADEPGYEIVNLGESRPVELRRLIEVIETELGTKAIIDRQPMQPGDVETTFADVANAGRLFGYRPSVTIEEGIAKFVRWFDGERGKS
jgi:UDP-glucuronate 4-epimerase